MQRPSHRQISRTWLVGLWFAAVAVLVAWGAAAGVNVGIGSAVLLLIVSLAPPAILLIVWRGAPPPTVGELLYAVNNQKDGL
jgi:SNF family Na+-dependent transporter